MTIDEKFRNEKLKFNINRDAAKMSGKVDKYEYLVDKILPSDPSQVIEQGKFHTLALEKHPKNKLKELKIHDQGFTKFKICRTTKTKIK